MPDQPASTPPARTPKPAMPSPEECCQSDCPNCVFTLYERELERWQEQQAAEQAGAEKT